VDETLIEVPIDAAAEMELRRLVGNHPGVYGVTIEAAAAYLIRRGVDDILRNGIVLDIADEPEDFAAGFIRGVR
jgi:hypothetical protein